MKILFFLLFISTANLVVSSKWEEVKFLPKVLHYDLMAIQRYYEKISSIVAYVELPNGISFHVEKERMRPLKVYLKIRGTFEVSSDEGILYDGLYYKSGNFYLKKGTSTKRIPDEAIVQYSQPVIKVPVPKKYLSIRYFGLEEIMRMIQSYHSANKKKIDCSALEKRCAFLAIAPEIEQFIECTLWCRDCESPVADGKLRVLIGAEQEPGKLKLSDNVEAYRLVFNQEDRTLTIPESRKTNSKPLENIFGIRMARIGFLAEIKASGMKMFNNGDFPPSQHMISLPGFIEKIKNIEPRFLDRAAVDPDRLSINYFQILGHILVKKHNPPVGLSKDAAEKCPLVIEYKTKGSFFLYGDLKVDHLCTNDDILWVQTDNGEIDFDPGLKAIILMHPEEKKQ